MADLQQFRVHDAADDLVDDLVERARAVIEDLDAHLERITATRDAVRAFLATIRATPKPTIAAPPAAPVALDTSPPPKAAGQVTAKPTVAPAPSKTERKRAPMALVKCPHCDFECTPPNMWRHTKSKHSGAAPKVVLDTSPPPKAPRTAVDGGRVLACSECDATFPIDKAGDLSRHTITTHKRGPLTVERQPVAA